MGNANDRIESELADYYVFVQWGDDAHGGPGWYYYDSEYTDEGSAGPFDSREEAVAHARGTLQ